MHLALIIDQERLRREHAMLQRITQDLREREVQVTLILPAMLDADDTHPIQGDAEVRARMQVPPWMRRARAGHVAGMLTNGTPDLIHAIGEQAWTVALDLCRVIDRPVTLDVWSADLIKRVPPGRAATSVAAYVTPTDPIAEAVRHRVGPDLVSVVPLGVEVPKAPRTVLDNRDASMTLAIIGSGRGLAGYRAMLTGLSRLISDFPQIQACLELRGPAEHEIWRQARRLDLLGHLSTIVDAATHRPLLTGCDVLVIPERLGEVRSIVLEAMAIGMPVVAADDPYLDMLSHDQTALIVDQAEPDDWTEKLRLILTDTQLPGRLADAARGLVRDRHRPAVQSEKLAGVFTQVLSGGAHTFEQLS